MTPELSYEREGAAESGSAKTIDGMGKQNGGRTSACRPIVGVLTVYSQLERFYPRRIAVLGKVVMHQQDRYPCLWFIK